MQLFFGLLVTVIYFGIVVYCLQLFGRLVRAVERIADRPPTPPDRYLDEP